VIAHIATLQGRDIKVTRQIEAKLPVGANQQVLHIVMEYVRTNTRAFTPRYMIG